MKNKRLTLISISLALTLSLSLFYEGIIIPSSALAQSNSNSNYSKDIAHLKRSNKRWIEINRRSQTLTAWQGNKSIYTTKVSTGKNTTPTPSGVFNIQTKYVTSRMSGPGYDIPDVPYTMYYHGNYAIHGAYWHRNFGIPVSQGCTNLSPNDAQWLFSWASVGTYVIVK